LKKKETNANSCRIVMNKFGCVNDIRQVVIAALVDAFCGNRDYLLNNNNSLMNVYDDSRQTAH